jgi:hypothetical protein
MVDVMLARERRALTEAADDDGCAPLAASLASLPSGLLERVAAAVAALGYADVPDETKRFSA